ncbi:STAS domain-containing protein [Novosphingobium sp. PhB57]|uniref:STAS domain-containing protein n=1 Tax=Novosphingobium sp. PhB57 TaxID=2485107 RepID=UPI0010491AFD|nr:STAS domain-containing protein [Novosphingobium sp. PhB57]
MASGEKNRLGKSICAGFPLKTKHPPVRAEAVHAFGEIPEEVMRHAMVVPDSVTVRSAHQFVAVLRAKLEEDQDVDLDLSSLAEVDLAFIEIIYSARGQWARAGRDLRLTQPASGAVAALLQRAGFLTDLTPPDIEFWFHGELPQ